MAVIPRETIQPKIRPPRDPRGPQEERAVPPDVVAEEIPKEAGRLAVPQAVPTATEEQPVTQLPFAPPDTSRFSPEAQEALTVSGIAGGSEDLEKRKRIAEQVDAFERELNVPNRRALVLENADRLAAGLPIIVSPLETIDVGILDPLAGLATRGVSSLTDGDRSDFVRQRAIELQETGLSEGDLASSPLQGRVLPDQPFTFMQANAQAFREWETYPFVKGAIKAAVDPLNLVPGFGLVPSPSAISGSLARGLVRSKLLLAGEEGFIRPAAITRALDKASNFRTIDRPGFTGRALDRLPGIKSVQNYLRPASKLPEKIQTAHVAAGAEKAAFSTKLFASRPKLFGDIDKLFGKKVAAGEKSEVRYIGPEAFRVESIEGTILDIAQRPAFYDLSEPQQAFLRAWQARNHAHIQELIQKYGVNVSEFRSAEGGVFLSNIDVSENLLRQLDSTAFEVALRGRAKTRIFESAADRILSDRKRGLITAEQFKPETNIRSLQSAMDEWQVGQVEKVVFKGGAGGKNLIEVLDETHPGLRAAKLGLTQKVQALKTRVATAERQSKQALKEGEQVRTEYADVRKQSEPLLERLDELGEEWGPELSTLSGQVRELVLQAAKLERRGLVVDARAVEKGTQAKSLAAELDESVDQLNKLQKEYAAANLRGFTYVEKLRQYFPHQEAPAVEELLSTSDSMLWRAIESVRGTAFGGDLSPIAGIQLPTGVLFNPKMAVQQLIGAGKESIRSRDLLRSFRSQTMGDIVSKDRAGWEDFSFYSGLSPQSGTPQEFAGGLLRHIPGYSVANDAMYTVVMRQMKGLYDKQLSTLIKAGVNPELSKAIAADMATKVYPLWNPRRLGLSPARAAAFRAMPTSISFLTRPAALMMEASTGFVKMATKQTLTPQELLASRLILTAAASQMVLSITSSVITDLERGRDPWKGVEEVINPTSGKFADIIIGKRRIPTGGPYRGLIKLVVPREVDWAPFPVPFANIMNFAQNRITPAIGTQIRLLQNRDFHGGKIRDGAVPEQILQTLLFEIEGMAPLTLGTAVGGIRREIGEMETAEEALFQFLGVNKGEETPFQERDVIVQQWARAKDLKTFDGKLPESFYELQPKDKLDFELEHPETVSKIRAETKRRSDQGIESAVRTQKVVDLKQLHMEQQQFDDSALDVGTIRGREWRDNRKLRQNNLNRDRSAVYSDLDVKEPETPTDFYYQKIDELSEPNGLMSSEGWDQLDQWLSQQPAEFQQYVEDNTRLAGLTPKVEEYYADLEKLQPYWDSDQQILRDLHVDLKTVRAWNEYKRTQDFQLILENPLLRIISRLYQRQKEGIFRTDVEIRQLLLKWEYRTVRQQRGQ